MTPSLDSIIEKFNNSDNDRLTVEIIDDNYDFLIDYKTDDLEEKVDISTILKQYFISLYNLGRYSDLIVKRDRVKAFIEHIRDKSDRYIDCYIEVEYLYAESLTAKGIRYRDAISSLEDIAELDPKNENLSVSLKFARLGMRKKVYSKIVILGLIIAFTGIAFRLIDDKLIYRRIDYVGFGIFILGYLIQYIDNYLTEKSPAANNVLRGDYFNSPKKPRLNATFKTNISSIYKPTIVSRKTMILRNEKVVMKTLIKTFTGFGLLLLLLLGCNAPEYRFTPEELNFLPYKLGDSISFYEDSKSSKTYGLNVQSYRLDESQSGFDRTIEEILQVSIYDTNAQSSYRIDIHQKKSKNGLKWETAFLRFDEYYYGFLLNEDSSIDEYYFGDYEIKSTQYKDVYKVFSAEYEAFLYLNSTEGFIMLNDSTNNLRYFFNYIKKN